MYEMTERRERERGREGREKKRERRRNRGREREIDGVRVREIKGEKDFHSGFS